MNKKAVHVCMFNFVITTWQDMPRQPKKKEAALYFCGDLHTFVSMCFINLTESNPQHIDIYVHLSHLLV